MESLACPRGFSLKMEAQYHIAPSLPYVLGGHREKGKADVIN